MIGHNFIAPEHSIGNSVWIDIDPQITTQKEFAKATKFLLLGLYTSGIFQL